MGIETIALGVGSLLASKVLNKPKAPQVSNAAVKDVTDQAATAKTSRAALYATEGGVQGQELDPNQVKKRQSLLGN